MRPLHLLAALAFASGVGLASCGNPCQSLAPICAQCQDSDYRDSCDKIVATNSHELCSEDIGIFNVACPVPLGAGGSSAASAGGGK